ncbi:unnamed protein product [Gongylonema pulchrum]|uniref:PseudoU_synth_2 domain-containing protein n=1 Tax=Gongylonema pulchrum TaxID=637853 RepID=A0A183EHP3_9BILA|nr:unnamed protein product [Gongylonema pulchrum]
MHEQPVRSLWQALHGIVCVHKPRDMSISALKRHLIAAICDGANKYCSPLVVPRIEMPVVEAHPVSQAPVVIGLRKQPDYSYCKSYFYYTYWYV